MNYTDEQLKQALAKMLSENYIYFAGDENQLCRICRDLTNKVEHYLPVDDEQLLHLCWLVEREVASNDWLHYMSNLQQVICNDADEPLNNDPETLFLCINATWQQRTIALAAVKSVEIV
jgi:hypothetical protein